MYPLGKIGAYVITDRVYDPNQGTFYFIESYSTGLIIGWKKHSWLTRQLNRHAYRTEHPYNWKGLME